MQCSYREMVQTFSSLIILCTATTLIHNAQADHYFEIDVDIGSSSVARNVTGLVTGYGEAMRCYEFRLHDWIVGFDSVLARG